MRVGLAGPAHLVFVQSGRNFWSPSPGSGRRTPGSGRIASTKVPPILPHFPQLLAVSGPHTRER
jgi:hypothetical protein